MLSDNRYTTQVIHCLDMPRSGPGRQSFRRGSKKRKGGKKEVASSTSPVVPPPETPIEVPAIQRRLSMAPTEATAESVPSLDDDAYAVIQLSDQIDEYYYGVRIFAGQDLSSVWVGWVTSQFHHHSTSFNAAEAVRKIRFNELDHQGKFESPKPAR